MQGQDQTTRRVGLDIDGVLANFPQGVIDRAESLGRGSEFPATWKDVDHWQMSDAFTDIMLEAWQSPEFWLKLRPLPYCLPLDFVPDCYITSRPIESWVTIQWLALWKFPKAPVFTVADHKNKLFVAAERGLDLFVDDYYLTIEHFLENGFEAVLYSAPYQRGHMVDHLPVISHLSEVNSYERKEIYSAIG